MKFVIAKGENLYIDPFIYVNGGLNVPIDITDLYTPYGFFIPMESGAWGVLDFLEGGTLPPVIERTRAFIVTHNRKIYSFSYGDKRGVVVNRYMSLPSLHWCASVDDNYVEAYSVLIIQNLDPLDAHEIVLDTTPVHKNPLIKLSIKEIAAKLTEMGYTKSLRYPTPEPKKDL